MAKRAHPGCLYCHGTGFIVARISVAGREAESTHPCDCPPPTIISVGVSDALGAVTVAVDAVALGALRPTLEAVRAARRAGEA